MTDQDQNLHVVTGHINHLAEKQQTAANEILGANRTTGDMAGSVVSSHGLVCSATSSPCRAPIRLVRPQGRLCTRCRPNWRRS